MEINRLLFKMSGWYMYNIVVGYISSIIQKTPKNHSDYVSKLSITDSTCILKYAQNV